MRYQLHNLFSVLWEEDDYISSNERTGQEGGGVVLLYSPHGTGESHLAHNPYNDYRYPVGIRNKNFWIRVKQAIYPANSLLEEAI